MLGTIVLILAAILGFFQIPAWFVIPVVIANNFIGMHTPVDRMSRVKEMGVSYWRFFFTNIPLVAVLTFLIYGIGFGVGLFFD